jgi:hypothetical protein
MIAKFVSLHGSTHLACTDSPAPKSAILNLRHMTNDYLPGASDWSESPDSETIFS